MIAGAAKQILRKPIPKAKLVKLEKLQCQIFRTTYNPTKQRTGAQILRKPLKGQTMMNYYGPADFPNASRLARLWKSEDYEVINEEEEYRIARVESLKRRGKGAPKKKQTASNKKK